MNDLLIPVRAIHLAATVVLCGGIFFSSTIAGPALRTSAAKALPCRRVLTGLFWLALSLALISGAAWLILLATNLTGNSAIDVIRDGTVWTVLTQTEFGHAWIGRLGLMILLGLCLALNKQNSAVSVICAAAFMGSLAWSGHAAGTPGTRGDVHRASDVLHLLAAGAWLGGLLPFILLLRGARRAPDPALAQAARHATLRFSMVGLFSVGALLLSGMINAAILVGGLPALVATDYGLLLLCKLGLFGAMILIATVNRFYLSPRLPNPVAMRELQLNVLIEAGLGLAILAIVAALGILPPASHAAHAHMH